MQSCLVPSVGAPPTPHRSSFPPNAACVQVAGERQRQDATSARRQSAHRSSPESSAAPLPDDERDLFGFQAIHQSELRSRRHLAPGVVVGVVLLSRRINVSMDSLFCGAGIDHVWLDEVHDALHRTLLLREGGAVAAEDAPSLRGGGRGGGGGGGGGGLRRRHEVVRRCQGEYDEGCPDQNVHHAKEVLNCEGEERRDSNTNNSTRKPVFCFGPLLCVTDHTFQSLFS